MIKSMAVLSEIAASIQLRPDGLWTTPSLSAVSYPDSGNQNCFAVEDQSFWFQHRNNCILEMLRQLPPPGTFFDIGGGNGYVTQAIQQTGLDVVLIEPGFEGARNARRRGVSQVICGTAESAGFFPGTLPAIGLFDVLEHIQSDCAFLSALHVLQPGGGRMYLTVPAFQALWSHEDKIADHWRRYTLRSISEVLKQAGYTVEFASYLFGFLTLPVLGVRVLPYRLGFGRDFETAETVRADHEVKQTLGRKLLEGLMRRELRKLVSGRDLLFGTSCLLVARRSAA